MPEFIIYNYSILMPMVDLMKIYAQMHEEACDFHMFALKGYPQLRPVWLALRDAWLSNSAPDRLDEAPDAWQKRWGRQRDYDAKSKDKYAEFRRDLVVSIVGTPLPEGDTVELFVERSLATLWAGTTPGNWGPVFPTRPKRRRIVDEARE